MIRALINALEEAELPLDHIELADALWLALADAKARPAAPPPDPAQPGVPEYRDDSERPLADPGDAGEPRPPPGSGPRPAATPPPPAGMPPAAAPAAGAEIIAAPSASALLNRLDIARALKPFKRPHPSRYREEFDVEETISRYCDTGFLYPVMRPGMERWFDVALVVDESSSMVVWEETIEELVRVFDRQGAFRDVHRWSLREEHGIATVRNEAGLPAGAHNLVDPGGRRLVLLISDCVSALWRRPRIWKTLSRWGTLTPVAIVQVLPQRAWATTALGAVNVPVWGARPGAPNAKLHARLPFWAESAAGQPDPVPIPVMSLDPEAMLSWARVAMGTGVAKTRAVVKTGAAAGGPQAPAPAPSAAQRVNAFRASVPAQTWRLARYLSVMPLRLKVMRLVQEALLPDTGHAELAEILVSGLLRRVDGDGPPPPGEDVRFEFGDGVRAELNRTLAQADTLTVYRGIARHLEDAGHRVPDFAALVVGRDIDESAVPEDLRPFISVGEEVAARVGLRGGDTETAPGPGSAGTASETDTAGVKTGPQQLSGRAPVWSDALIVAVNDYEHLPPPANVEFQAKEFRDWLVSDGGAAVPQERLRFLENPRYPAAVLDALADLSGRLEGRKEAPSTPGQDFGRAPLLVLALFGRAVRSGDDEALCLPGYSERYPERIFLYTEAIAELVKRGPWERVLCIVEGGPDSPTIRSGIAPAQPRTHVSSSSTNGAVAIVGTASEVEGEVPPVFYGALMQAFTGGAADDVGRVTLRALQRSLGPLARFRTWGPGIEVLLEDVGRTKAGTEDAKEPLPWSAAFLVTVGDEALRGSATIASWLLHPRHLGTDPGLVEQRHMSSAGERIETGNPPPSDKGGLFFGYMAGPLEARDGSIHFVPPDSGEKTSEELFSEFEDGRQSGECEFLLFVVNGRIDDTDIPPLSFEAGEEGCPGLMIVAINWDSDEFVRLLLRGFGEAAQNEQGQITAETLQAWLRKQNDLKSTGLLSVFPVGDIDRPLLRACPVDEIGVPVLGRRSRFVCNHQLGVVEVPEGDGPLTLNALAGASISGCPNTGIAMRPCTTVEPPQRGLGGVLDMSEDRFLFDTVSAETDGTPPGTCKVELRAPHYIDLLDWQPEPQAREQTAAEAAGPDSGDGLQLDSRAVALSIEMFAARRGTALLIRKPTAGRDFTVLFDSGGPGTFKETIRPRLEALAGAQSAGEPLPLDVVALSHMDDPNSHGLFDLLREVAESREEGRQPLVEIRDLWYNTAEELQLDDKTRGNLEKREHELLELLERLRIPRNEPFGGDLLRMLSSSAPPRVRGPEDLWISVLGPTLRTLSERKGNTGSTNDRSLVLLLETRGFRTLLTGDTPGTIILQHLEAAGLLRDQLHLDVLQIPHEGSMRFVGGEFIKRVTADHYLIAGRGRHFGGPSIELLEQLVSVRAGGPAYTVYFASPLDDFDKEFPAKEMVGMFASVGNAQFVLPEPGAMQVSVTLSQAAAGSDPQSRAGA